MQVFLDKALAPALKGTEVQTLTSFNLRRTGIKNFCSLAAVYSAPPIFPHQTNNKLHLILDQSLKLPEFMDNNTRGWKLKKDIFFLMDFGFRNQKSELSRECAVNISSFFLMSSNGNDPGRKKNDGLTLPLFVISTEATKTPPQKLEMAKTISNPFNLSEEWQDRITPYNMFPSACPMVNVREVTKSSQVFVTRSRKQLSGQFLRYMKMYSVVTGFTYTDVITVLNQNVSSSFL